MKTIRELQEQRASVIAQARALLDGNDTLTQEQENQYNAWLSEADQIQGSIDKRSKVEELERGLGEMTNEGHRPIPETQQAEGRFIESEEYRKMAARWLLGGLGGLRANEIEKIGKETRALQADVDIYGGYLLAPVQMVQGLIKAVDNLVFVRQWATVYQVMGAAEGLGAVSLDNDPADPTWTSELLIGTEDSTMSFGRRELTPHPLAKYIKLSRKLLRKVPSAEALVTQRLGYKNAVTMENNYLNGDGTGKPLGVFTASANGINTGRDVSTGNTATSMTFDGLKEAKYTLKGQYRGRARWLFHRDGVKQIAKLKDGEGRYIWEPSVRVGEPDMLLAMPCFESEYAPHTFTTGLYVGILGDWSNYWIVDDLMMELQRLDELYAATNQVGFIARYEGDGMPVLEEAFVRVTLA